jgi:cytochrome c556
MIRKSFILPLSTAFLVSFGIAVGLTSANDDERPLEEVMEQVQKHNAMITKGTRNEVFFKKYQKDVEKSAGEIVQLAKKAKPVKAYLKNAKNVQDPPKRWEELLDGLIKDSENLHKVSAKPAATTATFKAAKAAFGAVKKHCADCHADFRIDDTKF